MIIARGFSDKIWVYLNNQWLTQIKSFYGSQILKEEGLADNTIVVFTSDNGPWLSFGTHAGSAGLLRAGKGTTWEGGMRVPAIFWSPAKDKPAVVTALGTTMDLFITFSIMAGVPIRSDRIIDGMDLTATLINNSPSPHDVTTGGRNFMQHD